MSWFLTNLIATLLLPPLDLFLLALIGLLLWYKRPRLARGMITTALALLWLLSTPYVADRLLQALEGEPLALVEPDPSPQAIVVLGGGTYFHAPEYGGTDTVSMMTLVRLRYAAQLYRETHLPLLVTGGKPLGNARSEAQQMKEVLGAAFMIPVRWTEDESDNTFENAMNSYRQLAPEGIKRIYLVTHAWHMPRARAIFERAGFEVIPAPTAYTTRYQTTLLTFMPSADALSGSHYALHELLGMLRYRLKSAN